MFELFLPIRFEETSSDSTVKRILCGSFNAIISLSMAFGFAYAVHKGWSLV